jgi:hypothetical protein
VEGDGPLGGLDEDGFGFELRLAVGDGIGPPAEQEERNREQNSAGDRPKPRHQG